MFSRRKSSFLSKRSEGNILEMLKGLSPERVAEDFLLIFCACVLRSNTS